MKRIVKVGIPLSFKKNTFGVSKNYIDFIQRVFGEACCIRPLSYLGEIDLNLDIIILPGGADVIYSRYSDRPDIYAGKPDLFMEAFDTNCLPEYVARVPIFGICRGMQTLNVALGGTLSQHMYHETNPADDGYKIMHKVVFEKDINLGGKSLIRDVIKKKSAMINVNSRHHQCVDKVGDGFKVIARHPDDHTPEAIFNKEFKIAAVQWHPEDVEDHTSFQVVKFLIDSIMA